METFLYIIVGCGILYGIAKFIMFIYRPYGMNKLFLQLEEKYENLLAISKNEIHSANEKLKSWNNGEIVTAIPDYEEEMVDTLERFHGKSLMQGLKEGLTSFK